MGNHSPDGTRPGGYRTRREYITWAPVMGETSAQNRDPANTSVAVTGLISSSEWSIHQLEMDGFLSLSHTAGPSYIPQITILESFRRLSCPFVLLFGEHQQTWLTRRTLWQYLERKRTYSSGYYGC
jgi:hypothetical protein